MSDREIFLHPIADTDDSIKLSYDKKHGLLTIDVAVTPIICSKEQAEALWHALDIVVNDDKLFNEPLA